MVPPPAVPGDELDFDKMTPEEQLAWLESLARRQGVSEDELITAADMDVPIPENVVIDEPGYVPYSITGDTSVEQKRPSPPGEKPREPDLRAEAIAETASVPASEDTWLAGLLDEEPESEAVSGGPALDSTADAMQWLDELAVKADTGVPGHVASEEPVIFDWGTPEEEMAWNTAAEPALTRDRAEVPPDVGEEKAAETQTADIAEAPDADEEDFLGGIDPMRWLESLAVRQGAKTEELLTPADLSIEEPPPDTVIDEPGYVPFEASEYAPQTAEPQRQEELPAADVSGEVAEIRDKWPVVEEPHAEPTEFPSEESSALRLRWQAALEERGFDDDPLAWLERLATEPETDIAQFLVVEEGEMGQPIQTVTWPAPDAEQRDPLAGLSEEEIEQALTRGLLTPEQELAWLKRQAARLASEKRSEISEEGVEPAQPVAELPSWLAELQPIEEIEPAPVEEVGMQPADQLLADWASTVSTEPGAEELVEKAGLEAGPEAGGSETELQPAVPVEMPAWLLEETESPAQPLAGEDVPDWLRDITEEPPPEVSEEWLSAAIEEAPPLEEEADWLRALDKPLSSAGELQAVKPLSPSGPGGAVPVQTALEAADPQQIESYQQRLSESPEDHVTRLALARALWISGEHTSSFDHYENLIERSQLLPEVISDLAQHLQARPREARLHRLLGDAYLRHGRLKEALYAYRRALEHL
ncbi:MAG: hypothetical protein ACUVSU_00790 [Aggregatilineaceae bacterium]